MARSAKILDWSVIVQPTEVLYPLLEVGSKATLFKKLSERLSIPLPASHNTINKVLDNPFSKIKWKSRDKISNWAIDFFEKQGHDLSFRYFNDGYVGYGAVCTANALDTIAWLTEEVPYTAAILENLICNEHFALTELSNENISQTKRTLSFYRDHRFSELLRGFEPVNLLPSEKRKFAIPSRSDRWNILGLFIFWLSGVMDAEITTQASGSNNTNPSDCLLGRLLPDVYDRGSINNLYWENFKKLSENHLEEELSWTALAVKLGMPEGNDGLACSLHHIRSGKDKVRFDRLGKFIELIFGDGEYKFYLGVQFALTKLLENYLKVSVPGRLPTSFLFETMRDSCSHHQQQLSIRDSLEYLHRLPKKPISSFDRIS
ncbi:hypothetical protein [Microbulbifer sp. YPW1]|uniref:hypothetical protein n=1 Tax=Microbulbifer sp. YPW1 TaxID=2745199 RepID=UPI00159A48C1|nr:hypothetical protein [Microbulbifer sp. YPW1]QKX16904.1 hypothetical protein HUW35_07765 [Microbulbifer sp. YPW1]